VRTFDKVRTGAATRTAARGPGLEGPSRQPSFAPDHWACLRAAGQARRPRWTRRLRRLQHGWHSDSQCLQRSGRRRDYNRRSRWFRKRGTHCARIARVDLATSWLLAAGRTRAVRATKYHFVTPFELSLVPQCSDGHCAGDTASRCAPRATAAGGAASSARRRTWRATVHSAAAALARSACARPLT